VLTFVLVAVAALVVLILVGSVPRTRLRREVVETPEQHRHRHAA
jgi:hypothetical protein